MNQNLSELLASNLRRYRMKTKLSQNKFSRILQISNASMNRIEACDQNVSLKTIQTICDSLNISVKELFK